MNKKCVMLKIQIYQRFFWINKINSKRVNKRPIDKYLRVEDQIKPFLSNSNRNLIVTKNLLLA